MDSKEKVRIAICDDDDLTGEQLRDFCIQILDKNRIKHEILVTNSPTELCEILIDREFDLIFLDIEMPEMDGIKMGAFIREELKNEKVQIVYISVREQYAMELFEYRPLNFLIKPLEEQKIEKVLDKFLYLLKEKKTIFSYRKGAKHYKIPIEDITYFEKVGKKIFIHTVNEANNGQFYGKMDEVYSKLKDSRFFYIHKSIIVNYDYVEKFRYEQVRMIDGTELAISQSKRKEVRAAFMQLLEEEL